MNKELFNRGWLEVTFNDISKSLKRGPFGGNLKKAFFVESGHKVYEQQHAIKKDHTLGSYFIDDEKYKDLKSFAVGPTDYIVSCSGTIGQLYRLPIDAQSGVINQALLKIELEDKLLIHQYFSYLFQSEYFQRQILSDARGTGMQNLAGMKEIKVVSVLVPPLPEQRAIVAKIEQLFSELGNGIDNLKKAKEQLKMYRQAVLKKAFEGELSKAWRAQQTDLPTAEELLEQLKFEREAHYYQQVEAWKVELKDWESNGKEGKKPSNPKKGNELVLPKRKLTKVPQEWCSLTIDWFLSLGKKGMTTGPFGTLLKKSEHTTAGIPVLGIENIGEGVFRMPNKIFVSHEKAKELSSFEVNAGDVIISRSGTVGEICAVSKSIGKALISTNLIRVSLNEKVVYSSFFVYLFQGGNVRQQVKRLCAGSTRDFLNQTILNSITFPFPHLTEQHQIVQEIESRLSVCDKVEETIKESLIKAEALRQSILKKAFEGKLLSESELEACRNEPDWEPAEKLLERIKAERGKAGKVKKKEVLA